MGQLSKVLPDVVGQSNAYLVGAYILAVLIVCSCLIWYLFIYLFIDSRFSKINKIFMNKIK